jgi:hypothetical protein
MLSAKSLFSLVRVLRETKKAVYIKTAVQATEYTESTEDDGAYLHSLTHPQKLSVLFATIAWFYSVGSVFSVAYDFSSAFTQNNEL